MKWFQLDADTPNDPRIRRIIRELGNEGFGALARLWCFVAAHGAQPGRAVDSASRPYSDDDLADSCGLTLDNWTKLRNLCLEIGHFDRESWDARQEVFIPAQSKRADEFTKKRAREKQKLESPGGGGLNLQSEDGSTPESVRIDSGQNPPTVQDTTGQNTTEQKEGNANAVRFASLWNSVNASGPFKPVNVNALPEKWTKHIAARLKQFSNLEQWRVVFERMTKSNFLRGENDRRWVATFDWIIKNEENAVKVLAGKYDNRQGKPAVGNTGAAKPGKYTHLTQHAGGVM